MKKILEGLLLAMAAGAVTALVDKLGDTGYVDDPEHLGVVAVVGGLNVLAGWLRKSPLS